MQLSTVSTIQNANRYKSQRNGSSAAQQNMIGDGGNPLQSDAFHYQRHILPMIDGTECQGIDLGTQTRISDRTKRSDTAKRHVLSRQKPIQKEEHQTTNSLR